MDLEVEHSFDWFILLERLGLGGFSSSDFHLRAFFPHQHTPLHDSRLFVTNHYNIIRESSLYGTFFLFQKLPGPFGHP
jgi:hypothetical protein